MKSSSEPTPIESIKNLKPYLPGKPIEETQRELGLDRVVKLASNENPLGPSPRAILKLSDELKELHRYPDASGYRLKEKICAYHARKGVNLTSSQIVLGNGSNEIVELFVRTYCSAGSAVLIPETAFIAYRISAQAHGVRVLESKIDQSSLLFDLEELEKKLRDHPETRMVFIPNPNNPTGTSLPGDEIKKFLRKAFETNPAVIVGLDCAYQEYVEDKQIGNPMEWLSEFPRLFVMRTFSKIYGLAGLRVGYGVASSLLIDYCNRIRMPFNVSSVGLVAAEAALEDQDFVKEAFQLNRTELKYWETELTRLEFPFWKSQGNFVLVDVKKRTGCSGVEFFERCLKRGVIFRPVANYGMPDLVRISVGTHEENKIAVDCIQAEVGG